MATKIFYGVISLAILVTVLFLGRSIQEVRDQQASSNDHLLMLTSPELRGSARLTPEDARVCTLVILPDTSVDDYTRFSQACWRKVVLDRTAALDMQE